MPGAQKQQQQQRARSRKTSVQVGQPSAPMARSVTTARPPRVNARVVAPIATGSVRRMQRPTTVPLKDGDIRVTHREYFTDLTGSIAFAANSVSINPGLPSMFPWLSAIAQRFESYIFRKLKFCYETESATSTTGTLALAIDYDASDAAPTSKAQVLAYRSSVRSPPWAACCHDSLPEDLSKRKTLYVRSGALSANQDIKLYDSGNLFACTQGQAGATTIGELYVEYVIDLMTPQLGNVGVGASIYGRFSGTSNSTPFGTVTGNLPATVVSSGTTTSVSTFTFTQPWEGYATLVLAGTGITGVTQGGTGTIVESLEVANAGATAFIGSYLVTAQAGDTIILTIANTTLTNAILYWGQADV